MEAAPSPLADDYHCPNCGGWFSEVEFDHNEGWCRGCAHSNIPSCRRCGRNGHYPICKPCRHEIWYERHADEVELLVVTKGYSVSYARKVIVDMVRPICVSCKKPIKGGTPGESLFCSETKCRGLRFKFRRLLKRGFTPEDAIREVTQNGNDRT